MEAPEMWRPQARASCACAEIRRWIRHACTSPAPVMRKLTTSQPTQGFLFVCLFCFFVSSNECRLRNRLEFASPAYPAITVWFGTSHLISCVESMAEIMPASGRCEM